MMLKIYIAHNFDARLQLRRVIQDHFSEFEITSSWITDDSHIETKNRSESADCDISDIERADCLVLFLDQYGDRTGRGKWFEWGYACGLGMPVILIGKDTGCIFAHSNTLNQTLVGTTEEAIAVLKEMPSSAAA